MCFRFDFFNNLLKTGYLWSIIEEVSSYCPYLCNRYLYNHFPMMHRRYFAKYINQFLLSVFSGQDHILVLRRKASRRRGWAAGYVSCTLHLTTSDQGMAYSKQRSAKQNAIISECGISGPRGAGPDPAQPSSSVRVTNVSKPPGHATKAPSQSRALFNRVVTKQRSIPHLINSHTEDRDRERAYIPN